MISGKLNFLEPSGPLQACNVTALPFFLLDPAEINSVPLNLEAERSIQTSMANVKVIPQQAEVAQGIPGRLKPRIFLTFGTTRVVGR